MVADLRVISTNTAKSQEFINARNYIILSSLTSLRYDDMYHLHSVKVEKNTIGKHSFDGFDTKLRKPSSQARRSLELSFLCSNLSQKY